MENSWWLRWNPLVWFTLYSRYRSFRKAQRSVDGWAAIGSGLVALLEQHGTPTGHITLLPNPVAMTRLVDVPLPSARRPLVVGYVGALTEAKGIRVLVNAVQGLDVRLHVAGTGPVDPRAGSSVPTTVFGQVPERSMRDFYANVDIVVIPSLCAEAFGRVAVEAMAAGRPVIASDIGGLRDILQGCGGATLVPVGDVSALRHAINTYATATASVTQSGRRCRTHIRSRYHLPALTREFSTFIRTYVKNR